MILLGLVLAGCDTVNLPTLGFAETSITVVEEDEFDLAPQIGNTTDTLAVDFIIADTSIVNRDGTKFVAIAPGETTITASLSLYPTVKVVITVTVTEKAVVTYTLTYVTNGGTVPALAPLTFTRLTLPVTLPTPERVGYAFDGWYSNAELTGTALTQISIGTESNQTVYAKWTVVEFTIAYVLNGGAPLVDAPDAYDATDLPITLPVPTKAGYVFEGWFTSEAFYGTGMTEISSGTALNLELHAKWTPASYTITYDLNGGTVPPGGYTSFTVLDLPIVLPTPTKEGHTFGGWFPSPSFQGIPIVQIASGTIGNQAFYARWIMDSYSVIFQTNGGTMPSGVPTTFTAADLPLTLPVPTRTGYDFGGWFTNAEFTGSALTAISAGTKANQMFYAKWTIVVYTISYETNGGTLPGGAPVTFTVGNLPIVLPVPTRSGHVFDGWYSNAEFTGDSLTQIIAGTTSNQAFFARWTASSFTITYQTNGGAMPAGAPTTFIGGDLPLVLMIPTREGYAFSGWYANEQLTGDYANRIGNVVESNVLCQMGSHQLCKCFG